MRQKILAVAVVVLLAGQVAAQVDPADYADSGGAPKGAWDVKESPAPRGPQVNCSGAWTAWGACSPAAKQWRFFEPTRWAENGGRACPQPLAAEQSCEYPGQRLLYASGDAAALWRPQCASSDGACQLPLIRAAVGDLIVFVSPDGAPGVSRLASTWHHAECDFAGAETVDAKPVVTSGGVLLSGMYQYTVQEADRGRSIYLSGSEALQCARGQRVKVEVENFQHGTLAVAMQLLQAEAFKTAEGARIMVERLWCSVEHCPSSAVSFYRDDFDAAETRCEADSYSLLGLVARKQPAPNVTAAHVYYAHALKAMPDHCEAHAYLGELFIQTEDFPGAVSQYERLDEIVHSTSARLGCSSALASLQKAWEDKGWCAPPYEKQGPCLSNEASSVVAQACIPSSMCVYVIMCVLLTYTHMCV